MVDQDSEIIFKTEIITERLNFQAVLDHLFSQPHCYDWRSLPRMAETAEKADAEVTVQRPAGLGTGWRGWSDPAGRGIISFVGAGLVCGRGGVGPVGRPAALADMRDPLLRAGRPRWPMRETYPM